MALPVAIALAQIGEFSFILSTSAADLGILTADATNTLVATSIVSIVVNPLAVPRDGADRAAGWRARPGLLRRSARAPPGRRTRGPAARRAWPAPRIARCRRLRSDRADRHAAAARERHRADRRSSSTSRPCASCAQEGVDAIYGDATRPDTLAAAGVAAAGSLILTSAGMANSAEVIRAARS